MKRCEGHTQVWEAWGGPSPSTQSSAALSVTPLSVPLSAALSVTPLSAPLPPSHPPPTLPPPPITCPPFRFVECLSRFPHVFSVEGPRGAEGRVSLNPALGSAESRTDAVAGERGTPCRVTRTS